MGIAKTRNRCGFSRVQKRIPCYFPCYSKFRVTQSRRAALAKGFEHHRSQLRNVPCAEGKNQVTRSRVCGHDRRRLVEVGQILSLLAVLLQPPCQRFGGYSLDRGL